MSLLRSLMRFVTAIYKDASPTGLKNPCLCACRLGLRWQAKRDTAFARTEIFRVQFVSRPPESAVAAPALPAHSKIIHPKMNTGKEFPPACI